MLVVMVRIPVGSDEESAGLEARFKNRAGLVDNQPGFVSFELLKGDGEYISVTRWADQASLDAWMKSQSHSQAHSRVPEASSSQSGHDAPASTGRPDQPQGRLMSGSGGGGGSVSIYEVVIPGAGSE